MDVRVVDRDAGDFTPASLSHIWSWGWAGDSPNGSNVTVSSNNFGQEISFMGDLSGRGNHYSNNDPFGQNPPTRPAYVEAPTINSWSTTLAIVGSQNYDTGMSPYLQYMFQPSDINASGPFYLAFAGYDSRSDGHRVIWGTTEEHKVRYEQLENSVNITIDGQTHRLTERDTWSDGPILIEVWRDAADSLHAWVNGQVETMGAPTESATFRMNGIGGGEPAGNSAFDDYGFEYVACDGLPPQTERQMLRDYLNSKWNLY